MQVIDPTWVQSLLEEAMRLPVVNPVQVIISDEVPEPGRRLLRVLNPQTTATQLAEDVVGRIPELHWILDSLMHHGPRPEMVSDIEGLFSGHPLSQDSVVARHVGDLCRELRNPSSVTRTAGLASVLIEEEALGSYYGAKQTIVLFPKVIGPIAGSLGVSEDQLLTVVLAHETAHAVTHLGMDADRSKWNEFATADSWVKEAMAQYWARAVLPDLVPGSENAFDLLEQHQSKVYKLWRQFDGLSREQVRTCLVTARRTRPKATWEFCRGLLTR